MGRLQVLAGEGHEILVLPARAAAALGEDEGVRALEISSERRRQVWKGNKLDS